MSSDLAMRIERLKVRVDDLEVIAGLDLEILPGEIHAIMGPNGSGKSTLAHALMGRPGYEVIDGRIIVDGIDLVGMSPWERARAGLFLTLQNPIEVPGVSLESVIGERLEHEGRDITDLRKILIEEGNRIGFDEQFLDRGINVGQSGGEKKRNEILQLGVSRPRYAIFDEIDSGLDVDGLVLVANRIRDLVKEDSLAVLAVTHFSRFLDLLKPNYVHVLIDGKIQRSGGPELAGDLESEGYKGFVD
tara:strand:- start:97 stop:834 length:738 start_codon:yes stop_codon:yes gene_type:complete